MKVLERSTAKHVYRRRCIRCKSVIELDDEDKREFDLKYDESWRVKEKSLEERRNDMEYHPHNPMDYFDCPVCGTKKTYATRSESHKFTILENGKEYMDY